MSSRRPRVPAGAAGDVVVMLVWFAVLGVVAAVAWWQLAPEVIASRTEAGVVLDSRQLERQVGVDGWYGALAIGGGLLSGLVLSWWRSARPALVVALLALGGVGAGLLAYHLGVLLGPPDPQPVLASAAQGATAPIDLRLQAVGLVWAWPASALAAALARLVVRGPEPGSGSDDPQVRAETAPAEAGSR